MQNGGEQTRQPSSALRLTLFAIAIAAASTLTAILVMLNVQERVVEKSVEQERVKQKRIAEERIRHKALQTGLPDVHLARDESASTKLDRDDYDFTEDWFTHNVPVWATALEVFKGKPNLRYLEIGLFEGRSAIWMLENILTHPSARLTGIDIFSGPLKARFVSNVKRSGAAEKVDTIIGSSQEELRKLPVDSFDIVYIDGSHSARDVLEDAVLCQRLLKKGGLLIFDDYGWNRDLPAERKRPPEATPGPAIDMFAWLFENEFDVIHNDYQVLFKKRLEPKSHRRQRSW